MNRNYFTPDSSWMTALMFLPVQDPLHSDEDQAEQTFQALIEGGKVIEFDQGKFKPVDHEGEGELTTD